MSKIRLKASGTEIAVPTPPPAIHYGGEQMPANRRIRVSGAGYVQVVAPSAEGMNVGAYSPPPQNPIWVVIPPTIKPTKPCANC